ncbi:MAG: sulfatase-like hydrolase/transferase [Pirellulaceae bacterium]
MNTVMLLLLTLAQVPAEPPRLNFVVILADDLGYGDLGCYGAQVNRTPHLDRLAREGLRLTDFHSNGANCSPTRAALLTGRYQQRMGIEGALGENAPGLPLEEVTIAERLTEAGYATALLGKWHLGYFPQKGPTRQGFDEFVGHLHGATDYLSHVDKYGRHDWWHGEESKHEEGYNTTLITRHAVRFLEEHRREPFLLLVSHSAIHFPWMTPDDEAYRQQGERYEGAADKIGPHVGQPMQPVVQRMIEELDDSVGRIVATLRRLKLDERTLVLFTSDNGGIVRMAGVPIKPENAISSNAPLRGQKHGLYEGGHRVPAIAWWPGKIAAGRASSVTAMTMDLHPTLLELAGIPTPRDTLDGASLRDVLLGRKERLDERTLFWRQGDSRAVRRGDFKLVSIHDGPVELYDLGADLAERRDQSAARPQLVRQLQQAYEQWEAAVAR